MFLRALFVSVLIGFTSQAHAASAEVNLSEQSAKFALSSFIGGFEHGRTEMNAGYFFNTDGDQVAETGLHVVDVAGTKSPGLQLGIGGQLYYFNLDDADGLALALGGSISFRPPPLKRLNFLLHGHYAPDIVSFLDAERISEVGANIEYSLLPQADVFIGYRKYRMEASGVNLSTDDDVHIGLRIKF